MRVLMIEDDARYCALIRHHLTCRWPDAELVVSSPVSHPIPAPEYVAQGFDAVIVAYAGLMFPFSVFLMVRYIEGIPGELYEAAWVEGVVVDAAGRMVHAQRGAAHDAALAHTASHNGRMGGHPAARGQDALRRRHPKPRRRCRQPPACRST